MEEIENHLNRQMFIFYDLEKEKNEISKCFLSVKNLKANA